MRVGHLALQRKWREASTALMGFMMSPSRLGKITAAIGSLVMSATAPDDPSDLVVTAEAKVRHDFQEHLAEIAAPRLVSASARDPFYTETPRS